MKIQNTCKIFIPRIIICLNVFFVYILSKRKIYTLFLLTQHNLVCDDALLTSHAKMIFYFGVLVGDLVFGVLADR